MQKLTHEDLYSLEEYDRIRGEFRDKVMAHKKNRRLPIGPDAALYFEDRLTMHYQVQEMLRAERIFKASEIEDELATYNPLIPDGSNLKATFMVEINDPVERKQQLSRLIGIEEAVWLQVDAHDAVRPIANEDLIERTSEEKTSSVHFFRFELDAAMVKDLKNGACLSAGIDHPAYRYEVAEVPDNIRSALVADLD
jgi:hypothetical protein